MMKSYIMLSDIGECPSIQIGADTLSFDIYPITDKTKEIAKNELRETPENIQNGIDELAKSLQDNENLKLPLHNKEWLIRFLRPCKYYPDSAKALIERYFTFKMKNKDIFQDLCPRNEENVFLSDIVTVTPKRDQLGRRMLLLELGKRWKHKQVSLDEVFKACVIFLEIAMLEEETQVNGALIIFDMDGLSLSQAWQFTPQFAKRIVDFLQDAAPLRVKGIHVVNQPKIFQMVFSLFKPFLREKLKSRIVFHGDQYATSLHKHIDATCLPPCYGGTSDAVRITGPQWYELLMKYEKEFEAINMYGYKS